MTLDQKISFFHETRSIHHQETMHFLQDIPRIMLRAKTDGSKDLEKLNDFKNLTMICLENRLLYSLMKYFLTRLPFLITALYGSVKIITVWLRADKYNKFLLRLKH